MLEEIQEFIEECARLKLELEAYITDSNIPLQQRWDTWLTAPSILKNIGSWVSSTDNIAEYQARYREHERHSTVYMELELESIYIDGAEGVPDHVMIEESGEVEFLEKWNPKGIVFMESVLKNNLGEYCYDW